MELFGQNGWLIIPLAALAIPIAGIAYSALTSFLHYRQKRQALEVIRAYAAQGKDPPPDLVAALGLGPSDPGASFTSYGSFENGAAAEAQQAARAFAGDARAAARAARDAARAERYAWKAEFRHRRNPIRRWNNMIFLATLSIGLYLASHYARYAETVSHFQIGAVIFGALAAGALLSALLVTFFQPK